MPTNKTAELRHGPRFAKQIDGLHRMDALAAAERAVAKTGLAWWRSGSDDPQKGEAFDAACATLAKLEAK